MVKTHKIQIETRGNCHIVNITDKVTALLGNSQADGTVVLFHVGSTGALTTIEYEPGLVNHDMEAMFEKIAPANGTYVHEQTWHDDNGHAHVRASLVGPSLSIPVIEGRLALGTWQQIALLDFDTRPRTRTIVCQIID